MSQVSLPALKQGFADLRVEEVVGERFYVDRGEIQRKLLVCREGSYLREAGQDGFVALDGVANLNPEPSPFCDYLQELWHKESALHFPQPQPGESHERVAVPTGLLRMVRKMKDPEFSFRFTWEKRKVLYENTLGVQRYREDDTRVLRIDYAGNDIHVRKFLYDATEADVEETVAELGSFSQAFERAQVPASGLYDVVLNPSLSAVLAHEIFGHVAERIRAQWEWDYWRGMPSSGGLCVTDEPQLAKLGFSSSFDDEGLCPQPITVLSDGRFHEAISNIEHAYRLGTWPKGRGRAQDFRYPALSRMGNIRIQAGQHSYKEIMSQVNDGYYFVGALGGGLAERSFQIQAQYGYRIRNGKLAEPVKGCLLFGHLAQVFENILQVGNDATWVADGGCFGGGQFVDMSGRGGPHVLLKRLRVI